MTFKISQWGFDYLHKKAIKIIDDVNLLTTAHQ